MFDEPVLLTPPFLMQAILKAAAEAEDGTAGLDEAEARLLANLRRAREEPGLSSAELRERLLRARRDLLAARLLEPAGAGDGERACITERGREVLAAHPMGVDDTVLMEFPEYRAVIREEAGPRPAEARATTFDSGYTAYFQGAEAADNPYDFDTNDHLAWENGWFEARDEERDHEF